MFLSFVLMIFSCNNQNTEISSANVEPKQEYIPFFRQESKGIETEYRVVFDKINYNGGLNDFNPDNDDKLDRLLHKKVDISKNNGKITLKMNNKAYMVLDTLPEYSLIRNGFELEGVKVKNNDTKYYVKYLDFPRTLISHSLVIFMTVTKVFYQDGKYKKEHEVTLWGDVVDVRVIE